VSRLNCVGGGAGKFWSAAAARRWSKKSAAAAAKLFSKIPEKISFYPQNFLMTFFGSRIKWYWTKWYGQNGTDRNIN